MILVYTIENNFVADGILQENTSNKEFLFSHLNNILSNAFPHLNKIQIETFVLGLFNYSSEKSAFRSIVRDFLVNLKSFSSNDDELYQVEKEAELAAAEQKKIAMMNSVPGMQPVFNTTDRNNIRSDNYRE